MEVITHDLKGLRCPQPVLRLTVHSVRANPGDIFEVIADCPTFEQDLRSWCQRTHRVLLWIRDEGGGAKRAQFRI